MAEEANRAGDIHHPGPGVEEGEEDLTSSLVVPVVGLQRHLGQHGEGFRGVLLEGYPGIVDQDVNTAVFLLHEISQLDDRLLVANVQHVELGVQPLLSEGFHCRLAPALVPGGEVNISLVLLTQRPHYGDRHDERDCCELQQRNNTTVPM